MCRSLDDIELFMRAIAQQSPWLYDPQVVPLPWQMPQAAPHEKLCFGWSVLGDGVVQPLPPMKRALHRVRAALEAAGHTVIEFVPLECVEAQAILGKVCHPFLSRIPLS